MLLDKCKNRWYIMIQCSGYSAAWSSAFDWGSKGREFESHHSDHFFCLDSKAKKHEA